MKVFTGFLVLTFLSVQALGCAEHDTAASLEKTFKAQNLTTVKATKAGNNLVLVDGEVASAEDAVRVGKLVEGFRMANPAIPIQNMVRVSEEGWKMLAAKIERDIASSEITVSVKGKSVVLEGAADSEFVADRAVELARSHLRSFKPEDPKSEIQIVDMLRIKQAGKVAKTKKP